MRYSRCRALDVGGAWPMFSARLVRGTSAVGSPPLLSSHGPGPDVPPCPLLVLSCLYASSRPRLLSHFPMVGSPYRPVPLVLGRDSSSSSESGSLHDLFVLVTKRQWRQFLRAVVRLAIISSSGRCRMAFLLWENGRATSGGNWSRFSSDVRGNRPT